ncbi:cystatin 10-like [Perognathus longimembris pacificus]|uniref:cystatin 10-like n=1 Tax=Perognathus longimembris pacificus TaxID=214514 RepID=UPI0020192433|nr:cystatin 10-like [Perognathus longimembris pacificus]
MARTLRLLLGTLAIALSLNLAACSHTKDKQKALGGVEAADASDKEVQQMVDFSLRVYNEENNDLYYSRAVKVLSARQQVVNGMMYYLQIQVGRTTCTKSQSYLADCPFREQPAQQKKEICSFVVYTVPWLHEISMEDYSCHSA